MKDKFNQQMEILIILIFTLIIVGFLERRLNIDSWNNFSKNLIMFFDRLLLFTIISLIYFRFTKKK